MLHKHRDAGTAEMTFGVTDPIAQSQMAKFMRTVYLSGGLSGFSENNYPGMDHADYVRKKELVLPSSTASYEPYHFSSLPSC